MDEVLALIDKIIEEHRQILGRVQALEKVTNDAGALQVLDRAGEAFVPGRFGDQKQALQSWQESLEITDQGIQAHFNREETSLLTAFEKHGGEELASAWHVWLSEHNDLRTRLVKLKEDMAELAAGGSSRDVWEGKAWGVRSYLAHTRRLFEAHARSEQQLLRKLRNKVLKEAT
jgi:hemerythrin-like domain-containing protein